MNIKFPPSVQNCMPNFISTWLSWILSLSVKLKQKSTWCKVVQLGNRTPNDEENMQVKHMIRPSYRKRCSLGHRKRTRSNSIKFQRKCPVKELWKMHMKMQNPVCFKCPASCKLMCQLKWLEHFVPQLNPYRLRDYPSIASKTPHGAKAVDRTPSDSNINITHGPWPFFVV